jgi:hypothetical protein
MKAKVSEACLRALSLGRWSGIVMLLSVATLSAQSVSFEAPRELAAGRGSMFVAVGDFNSDGKLDVAIAIPTNDGSVGVSVLLNNTPL